MIRSLILRCTLCIFCVCVYLSNVVSGEEFAECEGVEAGTFVSSFTSCQTYIYCDGEDSSSGDCDEGQYFDSSEGACDYQENVQCFLDEVEPGEPEEEEPPIGMTTISTTIPTTTTAAIGIVTGSTIVQPSCPNSDDPTQVILIANSESCSGYFLCYHGHAMEMHCSNQLHFNANTGQCDFPENVQCSIDRPNANKCLPHVTDFFPHPDKCNYFYYCIKGFLTVQQCPFYYGWDIERRACVQISQAKCYGTSKRT